MTKAESDWTISKSVCEKKNEDEECRLFYDGLEGRQDMRQ